MEIYKSNDFVFSSKYRVLRHVVFWVVHIFVCSFIWVYTGYSIWRNLFNQTVWLPVYILYSYPLIYWVIPKYLLKGKPGQFALIILLWAVGGFFLNAFFRVFLFIPLQEYLQLNPIIRGAWQPGSYLLMTTTAGVTSMIVLFKYWVKKQQEWMQAEKEKVTAELQLLKAQVHPHFLFNTLNNIYSFSLKYSPKTPGLILKLSSLLSYMLYDCNGDEVLLEKEIEVMKNYIDLEKERYGNKIEISLNIEGDVKDKFIAPLLILPFLENAFKHGTSEQLESPWLSVDIVVKQQSLMCKILNSKNEYVPFSQNGIGIQNVKKRLSLLYPDNYDLKISDDGDVFIVALRIGLKKNKNNYDKQPVLIPVAVNA
jgi:two-component system, LytTR family, sensor histidine kinase AlgZ